MPATGEPRYSPLRTSIPYLTGHVLEAHPPSDGHCFQTTPVTLPLEISFGHSGNSTRFVGDGWAGPEQNLSWMIGETSALNIQALPRDADIICTMTVRPFVHHPRLPSQRLSVSLYGHELAAFTLTTLDEITFRIPARASATAVLMFHHPDAAIPADFPDIEADPRRLAIAVRSASFRPAIAPSDDLLVIAGGGTAYSIASILDRLTPVTNTRVRYLDPFRHRGSLVDLMSNNTESRVTCWVEANGPKVSHAALREEMPDSCVVLSFPGPSTLSLWPLRGPDPRNVPEPPRYLAGRYRWTDRVAAALAGSDLPDDRLFDRYLQLSRETWPDLDAVFGADQEAWCESDASCDVPLGDFILKNFRDQLLFDTPHACSPSLLRHLCHELLSASIRRGRFSSGAQDAMNGLFVGFAGWNEQLPIHPEVVRHFGLRSCTEGRRYRWGTNMVTFQDYIVNYIRWAEWL